ncbi:hypothetical protein Theba_2672 [Mesotoga prima MesG1.Ag.4.2]|uniref:ABM domain-containing protein n=1 Tax=Mesotoga prima MesG1.Ag.4.2 TaxID=660470 RepID=I2F8L8_9BACT|nr:antibiotic biosynthesis monooxygenase [Mesotoga prima]AFK08271.1 hypothetical protein Theba_2672 [Mesotoga prima MesG1.Ag.4.2]
MIVTVVDIQVKSEFLDKFIEATRENHKKSVSEPGNLRFDFLQDKADPSHFFSMKPMNPRKQLQITRGQIITSDGRKELRSTWRDHAGELKQE